MRNAGRPWIYFGAVLGTAAFLWMASFFVTPDDSELHEIASAAVPVKDDPPPVPAPTIAPPAEKAPEPAKVEEEEEEEIEGVYRGVPGLAAVWSDGQRELVLHESRLAFRLSDRQSPHPQLDAKTWKGRWTGNLNVQRPGAYKFFAKVQGAFELKLNGREVIKPASENAAVVELTSEPLELEYGPAKLEASFTKTAGQPALLLLEWQRPDGLREPVPASLLVHDPAHETANYVRWKKVEAGRRLVAERRCLSCHLDTSDDSKLLGYAPLESPKLDGIGDRVFHEWFQKWLVDPRSMQPMATMPNLFSASVGDQTDVLATATYLAHQLSDPKRPLSRPAASSVRAKEEAIQTGKRAFADTGCIACHQTLEETDVSLSLRRLRGIGSKATRAGIMQRIIKPLQHHPGSRMAAFNLPNNDPALVGILDYLTASRDESFEKNAAPLSKDSLLARLDYWNVEPAVKKELGSLDAAALSDKLGAVVVEKKGCVNCHQLGKLKTKLTGAADWETVRKKAAAAPAGCLAEKPTNSPDFQLSADDRSAIIEFMGHGAAGAGTEAPIYALEQSLDRMGCVACHERNGRGGTFTHRIAKYLPEGDQTARDLSPPALTAVGEKLRPDWIGHFIVDGKRSRPWMKLKMPQFAKERLRPLIDPLSLADGQDPAYVPPPPPKATPLELEAARSMVGRTVFNCVSCHDIAGKQGTGVRGPDLAGVYDRLKPEWFSRWLLDPQSIAMETRMPSIFFGGRSMAPQFLGGNVHDQLHATWAYLSQGPSLKLPLLQSPGELIIPGGEDPRFVPAGRPMLVHGFMADYAGLRGIDLGFPEGTHFAFDSAKCALTRVWQGEFAAVGGWSDSGRGKGDEIGVRLLGTVIWEGADQVSIATDSDRKKITPGPATKVRYDACWNTSKENSGFGYRVFGPGGAVVAVEDRPAPMPDSRGPAFRRNFKLTGDGKSPVWVRLFDATDVRLVESSRLAANRTPQFSDTKEAIATTVNGVWKLEIEKALDDAQWIVAKDDKGDKKGSTLWLKLPAVNVPIEVSLVYRREEAATPAKAGKQP